MSFLTKLLGLMSGGGKVQLSDQLVFNKVIAFKGVSNGSGASTIVQNVAIALARRKLRVCVIDTSFLYPNQHVLLQGSEGSKDMDFLNYEESLSDISTPTKNAKIDVFYMHDRTIVDMLGEKDDSTKFKDFLNVLKSYYDFILIDIAQDFTSITTTAGIKANKIILVADESLGSIYHLQKTLNTLATLAIPFDKMSNVILNKKVTSIVTPTAKTLTDTGLKLIGTIPLSMEIASRGVTGEVIYNAQSTSDSLRIFTDVIDSVVESIYSEMSSNPKNRVKNKDNPYNINKEEKEVNFVEIEHEVEIEHIVLEENIQDNTIQKPVDADKIKKEKDEDDLFDF